MAVNTKTTATGKWLRLLTRMFGLTGALALLAGLFFSLVTEDSTISLCLFIGGGVTVVLAVAVELRGVFDVLGSRRGAVGFNVLAQFLVVIVLVVGANMFSFMHYHRVDLTRDQQFTLPEDIREQLLQLRGDTEIVVYYAHRSFGQTAETKQDNYDFAAARKIVEKIKDLAEQFQDLGPRFRVHVLDEQDKLKEKKFLYIKRNVSEKLADQIIKAPENSIFLFSKEQESIQRISFSDIYHLDRQTSVEKQNLVLQFQGVGPFARKVFNIEEKRPHVALGVVHPWLGFQNEDIPFYTMSGAKKTLEQYSMQTTDVMLHRIGPDGDYTEEPTVLTYEESRFEYIEDELEAIKEALPSLEKDRLEFKTTLALWSESSLEKLNEKYIYFFREDGAKGVILRSEVESRKKERLEYKFIDVDDEDKVRISTNSRKNLNAITGWIETLREDEARLTAERATLRVDQLMEKRRVADIELKAKNLLANVDVLIVPRLTIRDATNPRGGNIGNRAHKLDEAQLKAIRWYLKKGKGVLFLLGPTNEPGKQPEINVPPADDLEVMLAEVGFHLPRQTLLYNIEISEFKERKSGLGVFGQGKDKRKIEVPGLRLDRVTDTRMTDKKVLGPFAPHPIRTSLSLMSRTFNTKDAADLRVRYPRPVYFVKPSLDPLAVGTIAGVLASPGFSGAAMGYSTGVASHWLNRTKRTPDEAGVFLVTRDDCWNEDQPFKIDDKIPSYSPTPDSDLRKGTLEENRRGPFPIGVAVETTLPASWYYKDASDSSGKVDAEKFDPTLRARIAVVGNGSMFVGTDMAPLKQKALLDMVNWLAGRDDLLVQDVATWQYPRAEIGESDQRYWFGLAAALPVLCLYFGFMVLMVRNVR